MSLSDISQLITEEEVFEKYGHLLAKEDLIAARKTGQIGFYKSGRKILYLMEQLVAYFETKRRDPCLNPSLDDQSDTEAESERKADSTSTKTNGSARSRAARHISGTGTTEMHRDLEESVAARWQPTISARPNGA